MIRMDRHRWPNCSGVSRPSSSSSSSLLPLFREPSPLVGSRRRSQQQSMLGERRLIRYVRTIHFDLALCLLYRHTLDSGVLFNQLLSLIAHSECVCCLRCEWFGNSCELEILLNTIWVSGRNVLNNVGQIIHAKKLKRLHHFPSSLLFPYFLNVFIKNNGGLCATTFCYERKHMFRAVSIHILVCPKVHNTLYPNTYDNAGQPDLYAHKSRVCFVSSTSLIRTTRTRCEYLPVDVVRITHVPHID